MARYSVNRAAVRHVRQLIDNHQYVLRSDWGDRQPSADQQNAFLERNGWKEYAAWHLGLTEGATDETRPAMRSCAATSAGSTAPVSSPACTGQPSGATRRSSWPPTASSNTSTRCPAEPSDQTVGGSSGTGTGTGTWV